MSNERASAARAILTFAGLIAGGIAATRCTTWCNSSKSRPSAVRNLPRHFSSRGAAKRHGADGGSELIVAENVDEYRGVIASAVRDGDTVLEIGCHEGMTTYLLACCCGKGGLVVGADKSTHWLARAKARFPAVRFELLDCFDIGALLQLQRDIGRKFSVIFVDISGSRELRSLIPLMEALECALSPELIVVKSFRLAQLQRRLQAADDYSWSGTHGGEPPCRAGSIIEVESRRLKLGNAMRAVQTERRRRSVAPLPSPADQAGRNLAHRLLGDSPTISSGWLSVASDDAEPRTSTVSGQNVSSMVSPARSDSATPSRLKQKSRADWSAVCWSCGVAKCAKAFSVRQQRQANGGRRAQCRQCVAARRHGPGVDQGEETKKADK